jgi:uncharacterized protein YgiM (DUF1202 family)
MRVSREENLATVETGIRLLFSGRGLNKLLALLFLLAMAASCAVLKPQPPANLYYVIPSVTYFRDSPGYASANVATVYRGQQVKILSKIADDWCQVEAVPGGQVGWIQRPLLSPVPIPTVTYTVTAAEVPLRDVPQKEAVTRRVLHKGDLVRKLSENQQGWWWVLVEKGESLGWLPGNVLSAQGEAGAPAGQAAAAPSKAGVEEAAISAPPAPPPYLYVAVANLNLHLLPLVSSQVVKSLKFNDKVEKIGQSGVEWLKVRYPETGAQGWAQTPTLTASPPKTPKVYPPPKKRRILKRPQRGVKPAEPGTPQPEEIAPEAM